MELIEERQNSLLNRRELSLNVSELASPPSMDTAKKMVAEKFSVPEENVHISKIAGKFGSNDFVLSANVYNTSAEREKFHVKKVKAKAGAAAPAAK